MNAVEGAHHVDFVRRVGTRDRHGRAVAPGLRAHARTQRTTANVRHGSIHATLIDGLVREAIVQALVLHVELLEIARTQVAAADLGGRGAEITRVLVLARGVYDIKRVGEVAHGGNFGDISRARACCGERLNPKVGRVYVYAL